MKEKSIAATFVILVAGSVMDVAQTTSAANVSSGTFGSSTGGGDYNFPGNVSIGSGSAGDVVLNRSDSAGPFIGSYNSVPLRFGVGYAETMRIDSTGKVGIGTTSPQATLHVSGSNNVIRMDHFGILDNPNTWLTQNAYYDGSSWHRLTDGNPVAGMHFDDSTGNIAFVTDTTTTGAPNPLSVMTILNAGNVGIGTTNPQYSLSVNGTIQAKEVLVNTGWADYVFQPDYRVRSLAEVAAFVKANHHLPDIPSETEIKDKGVSLGDMQTKLLAKIEELTLQMIQLDEQNRALAKKVAQLEGR